MSETTPASAATSAPLRRFDGWKAALVVSLALNLLFVGAAAARYFSTSAPERVAALSQVQLIPRKFFSELEGPRKAELLGVFRTFRPGFRDGRRQAREEMAVLAAALEAEPYDVTRVRDAVEAFSRRSEALVAAGGEAALALITRLDPAERKLLAQHIRQRTERGRGRGEDARTTD